MNNIENQYIYIPDNLIDENYQYYLNKNDVIITKNCNGTICTIQEYNTKNNITTEEEQREIKTTNKISYELITNDKQYSVYYRTLEVQETITGLIMLILAILFATFLTKERTGY